VDDRNETAHFNGNTFYSTEAALDIKITEILRVVAEIQTHSKPVVKHCYREFLLQNHDPDEREYADAADRIRGPLLFYHPPGRVAGRQRLSSKALLITLTELAAMAAPASTGFSTPKAASGMPTTL